MCYAPFVKPSQLVSISKALHVFSTLPDITKDINVTIDLDGPRRRYGDHEIWRWWQVCIEPNYVEVTSGGCFYQESTGGDTFTCIQWSARPGYQAEYSDYLHTLWMVDDAQPFEPELEQMDLFQPGYTIDVNDEDNPLLCDEESNPDDVLTTQENQEIILNLWYVCDDTGLIYSLRARAYIHAGSEEEKLEFLQQLAAVDYLIARPFPVPLRFSTIFLEDGGNKELPVIPMTSLEPRGPVRIADFFKEAFDEIDKSLPVQTQLKISQKPLLCITPLISDDSGNIYPRIDIQRRF